VSCKFHSQKTKQNKSGIEGYCQTQSHGQYAPVYNQPNLMLLSKQTNKETNKQTDLQKIPQG
jgi:hypothetical protein